MCTIYFLLVLSKRSIWSKECLSTCKDFVSSWEITTVPKKKVWRKLLKCWCTENVTDIVFFVVCGNFFFRFYQSVGFEGNIKYAKKGITSAMECADLAAFTFAMPDKWDRCFCKFISQEATVINLFAILRVFLVGLAIWSEFFGCFFWSELRDLKKS